MGARWGFWAALVLSVALALASRADALSGNPFSPTPAAAFRSVQYASCRVGRTDLASSVGLACSGFLTGNWVFINGPSSSGSTGTGTTSLMFANTTTSSGNYLEIGESGGVSSTSTSFSPTYYQRLALGQTAHTRLWVALTDATLNATVPSLTSAGASIRFAGIGYDPAVSADWLCCAGNGTTQGCADTALAADTSSHVFSVSIPVGFASPDISCGIDGAIYKRLGSASTSPASNAFHVSGPRTSMTTTANSASTLVYGYLTLETF